MNANVQQKHDISALSSHIFWDTPKFSMAELLAFYKEKISDGNEWLALRSLTYFLDSDNQPNPIMFQKHSWEKIKLYIIREAKAYGGY